MIRRFIIYRSSLYQPVMKVNKARGLRLLEHVKHTREIGNAYTTLDKKSGRETQKTQRNTGLDILIVIK